MKKCPVCGRTYTDENIFFCLEDGATLSAAASSTEKTLEYVAAPTANFQPRPFVDQTLPNKSGGGKLWMIPIAATLILILFGGVIGAFFLLKSRRKSSPANIQTVSVENSSPTPTNSRIVKSPTSDATPEPPPSAKLIGTWQADVVEQGVKTRITYTLNADGTSRMLFKIANQPTGSDRGTWRFSDGVLYEKFSDGASGKGTVRMIDDDTFEITILDNGTPAYTGVKRIYRRQ